MHILQEGFEETVRSRFGIDEDDLTNEEISHPLVAGLAESQIIKRVPNYSSIVEGADTLYLQNAVISMICAILCPSMSKRLNLKIAISDVKIEKERVDWVAQREHYLTEVEANLMSIESVEVDSLGIGSGIVGKIRNIRSPIGGVFYG